MYLVPWSLTLALAQLVTVVFEVILKVGLDVDFVLVLDVILDVVLNVTVINQNCFKKMLEFCQFRARKMIFF